MVRWRRRASDLGASSARSGLSCDRDFAAPAREYHNEATSSGEKAGVAVIDDTMAERMVACGWIAAGFVGLVTLIFSLTGGRGFTRLNLIDAALMFGLAYGIYRHSRTCSVFVLVYYLVNRALVYTYAPVVPPAIAAGDLLLLTLFVLGVIGTFVHHARRRPATA
jgi:hypothetical protein